MPNNSDQPPPGKEPSPTADAAVARAPSEFPIVAVGASAGGVEAFTEFLRHVPVDSGMAFVFIQHLDPTHPSFLTEMVGRLTRLPVREIRDGMVVEPDHVYITPPNVEVGILKGVLSLLPRPSEAELHRPIDFFFQALAADQQGRAIGVVLSGTGTDGTAGLQAIQAGNGVTFTQDPAEAKFRGMPAAAMNAAAADFVLPVAALVAELLRIKTSPHLLREEGYAAPLEEDDLKKILILVRTLIGADFSEYKPTTVRRRLARRLAITRARGLKDYVQIIRDKPDEARALFEEILIHVTSFFRDRETFERLKEVVFPAIIKGKTNGSPIRIWVAGCSSGEEVYSIAICMLEFLAQQNWRGTVQLFGTDISDTAIEKARSGIYPDSIARDVSSERLQRFFTRSDSGYRINKEVREMCAFVRHDLARDPPFSKLDLVSCRNVLIYFNPTLQRRVLANFHFALNLPGFLLIGGTENLVDVGSHFTLVDKDGKIFARTAVKSTLQVPPAELPSLATPPAKPISAPAFDAVRRMETLLLDQYAPPGVVVNDRMEILHFRGRTGPYLEPAPGLPQYDLLKMAREGLVAELRIAISLARNERRTVRRTGVQVQQNGSTKLCNLVVIPFGGAPNAEPPTFAVLFEDVHALEPRAEGEVPGAPGAPPTEGADSGRVAKLEGELASTKEYLQAIISEHQRTKEELTSTNEELVSSNEELQSLNEELETAREELQSTNEELTTLNEELQTRNTEVNTVNSDLVNILASVEVPIVVVDLARRIRRFTPRARPILNILPSDVGRPIDDIRPAIATDDLDRQIAEVIDTVTIKESEVKDREGHWYRLQIRPYTTVDKRIDGAVVSIVDIDVLKRSLGAAEWARDYAQATVEAVQTPLVVLDEHCRVLSANAAFYATFRVSAKEVEARSLYEIVGGAFDVPIVRQTLAGIVVSEKAFQAMEIERELPALGIRTLSFSARMAPSPTGIPMIVVAIADISERKRMESEVQAQRSRAEDANRAKDLFLAMLSHELRTPLSTILLQAELLQRAELDAPQVRRTAEGIRNAAKMQAQLVDDLLDVSRIVAGQLKIESRDVDLGSVIHAALETVQPVAERKGVQIHVELDEAGASVSGDAARLQQVVWNLLVNAIKFTPEQGDIWVTLDVIDKRARIRVRDSGIGIDPEFLPHIFDQFAQEDRAATRVHGGLGLGLSIVRYLVDAHRGTITAESPGKARGATFTVTLPLQEKRQEGAARGDGRTDLHGVRVLVVDDDLSTRDALAAVLRLNGADVRTADSAARALEAVTERKPDLLICDIAMPQEDGYSLIRKIRALDAEHGGDVPAMGFTALASDEDKRRAMDAGFQMHVAKPIDADRLLAAVAQLLPARRP